MFSYRSRIRYCRAPSERFAAEGGQVFVIDRDEKAGKETVDIIIKNNGGRLDKLSSF